MLPLNHTLLRICVRPSMTLFKSQQYMTPEQQTIALKFLGALEVEYALCVGEIQKAQAAIADPINMSDEQARHLDFANREIDAIAKYWQQRLVSLIDFIETNNSKINKELAIKYLNHQYER